ncbi:uncharacterized protein TNCV_1927671 [Trichonephila clavipes]|nr:uncharacterized protein TNCV_1927671 [Trichonephila clavipes]
MYSKCIVPARHGGTLNSRRAASPLVRLVEGEEKWEASDHPRSVLPLNWGGIESNRTVTCMVLKAMANDRCHLALCHDEFRGSRSGLCRSDQHHTNPDYNTTSSILVHFQIVKGLISGPCFSPYKNRSRISIQTKSQLKSNKSTRLTAPVSKNDVLCTFDKQELETEVTEVAETEAD